MTRARIPILFLGLCLVAFAASPSADSDEQTAPVSSAGQDDDAKSSEASKPAGPLIFVPPPRGAPVTVGGATRGVQKLPRIQALVPGQIGLTLEAQPTLYWYLAEPIDASAELSIVFGPSTQPLVDTAISGQLAPGLQRVRLADFGVKLDRGVTYQWTIRVMPDPSRRAASVITGGVIERVDASPDLTDELKGAGVGEIPYVLARNGVWYDTVDAISRQIEASPDDAWLRERRAELLAGVGLDEIAAADRSAAGGS